MRIVYSILHFQSYEMTVKCVESILNVNHENLEYYVLIIDNGSKNDSGRSLVEKYNGTNNIIVKLNPINEGFARGNNHGYKLAREELKADIVIVMNNDVIIEDNNFCKKVVDLVNKFPTIDIFAPDIINKEGQHQNPVGTTSISMNKLMFVFLYSLFLQIVMRINGINNAFLYYLKKRHLHKKKVLIQNQLYKNQYLENIVPHGAIIIYSNRYLRQEKMAFNPNTFLYCEEDLLFDYLQRKNYQSMYSNTICVKHLEDIATNEYTKNEIKKKLFMSRHKLKSCLIVFYSRLRYKI